MYNKGILDRFLSPQFAGSIRGASGVGQAKNEVTSEVIKFNILVDSDGVIYEAKFKAFGGAVVIAVADNTCETLIGLSVNEAEELHESQVVEGLGEIPEEKWYVPVLAINAINATIDDYYKKLRKLEKQKMNNQNTKNVQNTEISNNEYDDINSQNTDKGNEEHLSGSAILAKYFGNNNE